jgi:transcriptional regulator NrdR family protein
MRRRASDVLKPECPWCGGSTSAVYRSWQRAHHDGKYRRRRQCADCGQDWPTVESLDVEQFARELARTGRTLADVGVERADDHGR